jgi:copper chaperone CopZ
MRITHYAVEGMSCGHCAQSITDTVTRVPGVSRVEVDVAAESVRVSGHGVADGAVREAIVAAGFAVRG